MSALQWIGLGLGLLIIVTRLPLVIWPERILGWLLDVLARSPRVVLRGWGAFASALALAIAGTVEPPLSLLEGVMGVLAVLFAGVGAACMLFPESAQKFVAQIWGDVPPRVVRTAGAIGVVFGAWLVSLSLSG